MLGHSPKGQDGPRRPARHQAEADRAENGRAGMAGRVEYGRQEDDIGARAECCQKLALTMGGRGRQPLSMFPSLPARCAVESGPVDAIRRTGNAAADEPEVALSCDPGENNQQPSARFRWPTVVAQDDSPAAWQTPDRAP